MDDEELIRVSRAGYHYYYTRPKWQTLVICEYCGHQIQKLWLQKHHRTSACQIARAQKDPSYIPDFSRAEKMRARRRKKEASAPPGSRWCARCQHYVPNEGFRNIKMKGCMSCCSNLKAWRDKRAKELGPDKPKDFVAYCGCGVPRIKCPKCRGRPFAPSMSPQSSSMSPQSSSMSPQSSSIS